MALSRKDAVEAARSIMHGQRAAEYLRLKKISDALKPKDPTVQLPTTPPAVMYELAKKSQTNYLPLILDVMAQALIVTGYNLSGSNDHAPQWSTWQANRMDARQTGVHRSALAYGASYVTVLPADQGYSIRGVSPRKMTAIYGDVVEDDWPLLALRDDDVNGLLKLYDEEQVYYLSREITGTRLEFIEARAHNMGVCPVVRFRDRMLLDEDEQLGLIEPLIPIQQRVDETIFGLITAQFYAAFKQRYVIGWIPESEEQQMRTAASQLWAFADSDVKVGELQETDLTRYLASKDSGVSDMATISQVPKQNLGLGSVSNLSAEALAAMEASKDRKSAEIQTSLGESWEQVFGLASPDGADDEAEVRWKDSTARSFAQMVDGLGKMVTMLNIPYEAAWERIPGISEGDLERWRQMPSPEPSPAVPETA